MRVLMISRDSTMISQVAGQPGDTRERHIKYARALRARYPDGHISAIVPAPDANTTAPVDLSDGLTAYPIASSRLSFALRAWRLGARLCVEHPYDLITTQTPFDDACAGALLKRRFGIPLNVQMHASFLDMSAWIGQRPIFNRGLDKIGKWTSRRADTVRVVCEGERRRLSNRFPWIHDKLHLLHSPVNAGLFARPATEDEKAAVHTILESKGEDGDVPIVLFVGRLVDEKNVSTLLKAFQRVIDTTPNALLVIAGDGYRRPTLQELAGELKIHDRVLWLGSTTLGNLRGWYEAARMTVLPSHYEGFGMVIAESYLMGTPVVVAPFISARELTPESGQHLIAQTATDSTWFAQAITGLLDDPEAAIGIGDDGRSHMQDYLLPEIEHVNSLIDIWERTANRTLVGARAG